MRGNNSIKEQAVFILKKPMFYFCLFFMLVNLVFTKQILDVNNTSGFAIVAVVETLIELGLITALYKMKKNNTPLEKMFLLVALVLGVLFIVILPPGQSPDEVTHFKRVYGISDGILLPEEIEGMDGRVGSEIPTGTDFLSRDPGHGTYLEIVNEIDDGVEEKSIQTYTSAALYSFVCYIPQIIGILIGRLFGFSVLGMSYLMEIFNFAVWVFLIYYSIKLIPKFKSVVLFISLLPITIQEATSLSPDALTIGLCTFFISYTLYLAYGERKKLERRDYAVVFASSAILGFCKIVYLPLVLLLLLIPKEKFKTNKNRWLFLGLLFVFIAIINMAWLVISSRYLVEYRSGVNSKEQLIGIIQNPFRYLMVIFRSINTHAQLWLNNMLGMNLGAFKFNLPSVLFYVTFSIMIVLFIQRVECFAYKKIDRWIIAFVFLTIVILIMTSLYMQWTPYGEDLIDGVQGRYYLPILMLIPLIFCTKKPKRNSLVLVSNGLIIHYGLFINIIALVTIFAQNA